MQTVGRLPTESVGQRLVHDDPTAKTAAMLSKQDEVISVIKSLGAALEADPNTLSDGTYAGIVAELEALEFIL